jgi:hypothetical protein
MIWVPVIIACCLFILAFSNLLENTEAQELEEFGSINQVGSMNEGRYNHTVTLLDSGKVLVLGGTGDGKTSLDSAEVYDPETGVWSILSPMSQSRMRHTATGLDSGKVLVTGGYDGSGRGHPSLFKHYNGQGNLSLPSCEIYNPDTDQFTNGPDLVKGRFWHRAVGLADGRVLVMGGLNVTLGALSSCELYDPDKGVWEVAASMNRARVRFSATLLSNGWVLVAGGHNGQNKVPFSHCELYLPLEDKWIEVTSMNRPRGYHAGILTNNGKVLVSGGFSGPNQPDWSDAEIYDPVHNTWTLTGNMSLPRHNHECVLIPTDKVVTFGGSNCLTGGAHSGIEYFDSEVGTWHDTNLVMLGLKWTKALALGEDYGILIAGGKSCNEASSITYIYSPPEINDDKKGDTTNIPGLAGSSTILAINVCIFVIFFTRKDQRVPKEKEGK